MTMSVALPGIASPVLKARVVGLVGGQGDGDGRFEVRLSTPPAFAIITFFFPEWMSEPWCDRTVNRPDFSWIGRRVFIRPRLVLCDHTVRHSPETERAILHEVAGTHGHNHHILRGTVLGRASDRERSVVVDCGMSMSVDVLPTFSLALGQMLEAEGRLDAKFVGEIEPILSLPLEWHGLLGDGVRPISSQVLEEFEASGIPMVPPAHASVRLDGTEWRITDAVMHEYLVAKAARGLNVYSPP